MQPPSPAYAPTDAALAPPPPPHSPTHRREHSPPRDRRGSTGELSSAQTSPPLVPFPSADLDPHSYPHPAAAAHSPYRPPPSAHHEHPAAYDAYSRHTSSYDDDRAFAPPPPPSGPGYYPHSSRPDDGYRGPHGPPHHPAAYRDPYAPPAHAGYPHYAPTRGPPSGYGAYPPPHPHDPYGPPPRDPYGRPAYGTYPPPRESPYGGPPPAHDYYGRPAPPAPGPAPDYYSRQPPPPASTHAPSQQASYPAPSLSSSRSSAEPPSSWSRPPAPPDPNDLSIPLLYLARSVHHKTFVPLRAQFPNLELRFINSLLDLSADLHAVSLEHPHLLAGRRRVWVTAVGGTDALVARVRATTETVLDWREVGDLAALERELAIEDRRVVSMREEDAADRARRLERDELDRRERAREDDERDRGRREIEERERERERVRMREGPSGGSSGAEEGEYAPSKAAAAGIREPDELNEVLRAVRGEAVASSGPTSPVPFGAGEAGPESGDRPVRSAEPAYPQHYGYRGADEAAAPAAYAYEHGAAEPARGPGPGEGATPQSPGRSARKRSRHEDLFEEPEEDKEQRRAERKRLEAVCKMPRKRCVDESVQQGVPPDEEARAADDELQLGERHKGIWDLFGQPLDDVSPQIQVLMARALRDVTYPPRLRLYDHPEALEQLESAVPWFVTMLQTVKHRYELAAADPPAPLDPPAADPLESTALETGV